MVPWEHMVMDGNSISWMGYPVVQTGKYEKRNEKLIHKWWAWDKSLMHLLSIQDCWPNSHKRWTTWKGQEPRLKPPPLSKRPSRSTVCQAYSLFYLLNHFSYIVTLRKVDRFLRGLNKNKPACPPRRHKLFRGWWLTRHTRERSCPPLKNNNNCHPRQTKRTYLYGSPNLPLMIPTLAMSKRHWKWLRSTVQ